MAGRFIKLYDKILQWEWYGDANTFRLFLHLLLKANYKDLNFEGRVIHRGQVTGSLTHWANELSLTVRQVRVSLKHLKMTGEVTVESNNRYSVITIVRYDDYQSGDRQSDRQVTGKVTGRCQADDRQMTGQVTHQMTTSIEDIENIEQIEKIEQIDSKRTAKRFVPPTKEEIFDFCMDEGLSIDVDYLFDYYSAKGWKVGSSAMKDWKAAVRNWARREKKDPGEKPSAPARKITAQQYTQRPYDDEQQDALRRMIAGARGEGMI